ncbi:MAG TPA: glucosaminidase domain-containing protein [Flavobacterium sp.]
MIKKLSLLIFATLFLLSCNASKPVARTGKPVYKKSNTAVARNVRRPINRTKSTNPEIKKIERQYEKAKEDDKSSGNESVYSKTEILAATTRVKVTTEMVFNYIDTYKDIAKSNMAQYGIPASIILGQGILESGAGTGPLSTLANNHFGIKCHKEWTGPSVKYDDDEAQECFRQYEDPSESYRDHSKFLSGRPRYLDLFALDKDDYKRWAKGLKNAGYATDPKYPDKLIGIIERYQLSQYDAEVLGRDYVPIKSEPSTKTSVAQKNDPVAMNADVYQVTQGDTLYSISKKFNLTVDELRRKNNISDNSISIGQSLKIK